MSYRCGLCNSVVPPRVSMMKHTIYRTVSKNKYGRPITPQLQIAREIPVCAGCNKNIETQYVVKLKISNLQSHSMRITHA